jgi:hypothetical protein
MSDTTDLLGFTPEGSGELDLAKSDNPDPPYIRGDRFSVDQWRDKKKMITWMNQMRKAPIDGIDDTIVNESYSAAVWLFRQAAIDGDLKATTALKMWLEWAKPITNRKKPPREIPQSPGSVAFLPREVTPDEE